LDYEWVIRPDDEEDIEEQAPVAEKKSRGKGRKKKKDIDF
jgi:hypothetical protein